MDSLFNLLANRMPDQPPEIVAIKKFVRDNFRENAGVQVRERDIVVTVRSSALAGMMRTRAYQLGKVLEDLRKESKTDPQAPAKRLIFRVGSVEDRQS